jgi:hypothetical protein
MRIFRNSKGAVATLRLAGLAGALALCFTLTPAAFAQQKAFATPEAAMEAFGDALARSDSEAMTALLGSGYREYIPQAGADYRYRFLAAWAKSHAVKPQGDGRATVAVGTDGWTLPIPIVKTPQGWQFDMRAGADEMRIRRIGRNELAVMQAMLAIYDAQMEYALVDRDGNGLREYAAKFESLPGKQDGLYWSTKAGEPQSPLGPAFAAAKAAGGSRGSGYHGYRFRLLNAQGGNAPGGAYEYTVRGRRIGGFAAVAWPVKYGDTGVMTFMVSHDGVVYEKDLGPDTAARAGAITRFDPDASWIRVDPAKP